MTTDFERSQQLVEKFYNLKDDYLELKNILFKNQNISTSDGSFDELKWTRLRNIIEGIDKLFFNY